MYRWKVCPVQGRQLRDVRHEDIIGDFRICKTYRGGGGYDQFPEIALRRGFDIAELKGNPGIQFVVQLYGCTLDCPYCYVTKDGIFGEYREYTSTELSDIFSAAHMKFGAGVFHLMGGAPALYHSHWPELLEVIPEDVIFHSDLMLVEKSYDLPALNHCQAGNALYAVNIKGVNAEDHFRNTGRKLDEKQFWFNFYCVVDSGIDFYLTFTNPDKDHLDEFKEKIVGRYGDWVLDDHFVIDLIDYEALK
jgi:pyruvate-formate lyase-activating enzyme